VIPEDDTGVGDVLRQNAQDLPAVQPAIQALRQSGACYDDLCGKAAETNGLNLLTGLLVHPKGSNGRVPSPPQSVPGGRVQTWEALTRISPSFCAEHWPLSMRHKSMANRRATATAARLRDRDPLASRSFLSGG
jgi:hypothetical protein